MCLEDTKSVESVCHLPSSFLTQLCCGFSHFLTTNTLKAIPNTQAFGSFAVTVNELYIVMSFYLFIFVIVLPLTS